MTPTLATTFELLVALPSPQAPPGLDRVSNLILGWGVWALRVGGIAGLLLAAFMIIVGRRNRNQLATEGVFGSLWVVVGLAIGSSAAASSAPSWARRAPATATDSAAPARRLCDGVLHHRLDRAGPWAAPRPCW